MGFIGLPLQLELLATRRPVWRIVSGYRYKGSGFLVEVPTAWMTDLTSIPWWIPFLRREGEQTPASVVHDVVYAKGRVAKGDKEENVDRLFADRDVYPRAMEELETPPFRRAVICAGVRIGGWRVWRRYRKKQLREAAQEDVEPGEPASSEEQ